MKENSRQSEKLKDEEKAYLSSYFDVSMKEEVASLKTKILEQQQRYTESKEINSGGMKRIFSCVDQSTDRLVAKAVLREGQSLAIEEDFLREARITASLQHPNIIPVYDIGIDSDGQPFFTMKLVEGKTLT